MSDLFCTPDPREAQAKACWEEAISLLKESGMAERKARTFFGMLLSRHRTHAADFLSTVRAARASGTMDAAPYLQKAAQRRALERVDGAMACTWG